MNRWRWQFILGIAILLTVVPSAFAQGRGGPREPHIGYLYPAGGQQGATFTITIGGQYLDGASHAVISGGNAKTTVLKHKKPLSGKKLNEIREIVQKARKQLQGEDKKGKRGPGGRKALRETAIMLGADPETLDDFNEFIEKRRDPKRQLNPQLSETVTLEVTLDSDAPPGQHELRLMTRQGLSNPLVFHIDRLPEFRENEPNDKTPDDILNGHKLPAVVNGQIMPGDVDRFSFKARKGQRLVIAAAARELIPYLADAVPGWFQATLTLRDAEGNEVAYADDYRFHPDPVLYFIIPKNGKYVLEIKDAIYRGREDFVYRITLGEVPFVTSLFPLGGRDGVPTMVKLTGWNLPKRSLTIDAFDQGPGVRLISVDKGRRLSNRVPFATDILPECLEKEPNQSPAEAQRVRPPVVVNGRIDKAGDTDVFRFHGRRGGRIVVEVLARRLGSPLDSVLKLTNAAGKPLIANDDCNDPSSGLSTHHADSRFLYTLPAEGDYDLHLSDARGQGSPAHAYRLRISPRQHDFELRVVPSTINASAGATVPITVHALRRDGFNGDIKLALKDSPDGFHLSGGWVPSGQDQVRLTLTVPPLPQTEPYKLRLEGRARIYGHEVRREATPADDWMQAFIYHHLVPTDDWIVGVIARRWRRRPLRLLDEKPLKIPRGATAQAQIAAPRGMPINEFRFVLNDPPEGISIKDVSTAPGELDLLLKADAKKAKAGLKGNLIVDVSVERIPKQKNGKKQGKKRRIPLGTLPAIPFEIVDQEKAR